MNDYNLFGIFLKEKRLQSKLSYRELANKSGISHIYILNFENGKRPPPNDVFLKRLAVALELDDKSADIFYDLAAKCKQIKGDNNFYLPADISSYLSKTENARQVIRKADKLGYSNEFWNEILKQLK